MATVSLAGARRLTIVTLSCVFAVGATAGPPPAGAASPAAGSCPAAGVAPAYTKPILDVLGAGRDVWGDRLLALPGGPSHAAARRYLKPLMFARGAQGRSLTASGVYYLPFAQPDGARGAGSVALHVADGSQIVSQHAAVHAGPRSGSSGRERFGSCLARLATPALAGGYLPILETRYVDSTGARYTQESFAARVAWTQSLVSFVQISVDTRRAKTAVRLRLFVFRLGSRATVVPRGTTRTVYAAWVDDVHARPLRTVTARSYADARGSVVSYWTERLADGASISVPEPQVENAARALLVQDSALTWRYGSATVRGVLVPRERRRRRGPSPSRVDVARSILRTSLTRRPTPYPNWKMGARLVGSAEHFRLIADRAYIRQETPVLRRYVTTLGRQIGSEPERAPRSRSGTRPTSGRGLRPALPGGRLAGPACDGEVWGDRRLRSLATQSRRLAIGSATGCDAPSGSRSGGSRTDRSSSRCALLEREQPYRSLTASRAGSYWNLVMPYAFASGLFAPDSREATRVLRYMLRHGSRLLGLVRAGAYALYGEPRYPDLRHRPGLRPQRRALPRRQRRVRPARPQPVRAARRRDDAGTFVSGESASIAPLAGPSLYRTMYLPPNGASNAAFLETLRLMLVHETTTRAARRVGSSSPSRPRGRGSRPASEIAVRGDGDELRTALVHDRGGERRGARHRGRPGPEHPKTLTPAAAAARERAIAGVTAGGRPFRRFDPGRERSTSRACPGRSS